VKNDYKIRYIHIVDEPENDLERIAEKIKSSSKLNTDEAEFLYSDKCKLVEVKYSIGKQYNDLNALVDIGAISESDADSIIESEVDILLFWTYS